MAKMHTGELIKKSQLKEQKIEPTIVYIDRPVEIIKEVEKIIHVNSPVVAEPQVVVKEVEKIIYIDKPVEVIKEVEKLVYKTIEVPVEVENIEKIRHVEIKYQKLVRKNLFLVIALSISAVISLALLVK